jgi:hypothetical protein
MSRTGAAQKKARVQNEKTRISAKARREAVRIVAAYLAAHAGLSAVK